MKTYEQMAQDALQRINAIHIKRRCRRRNVIRATVALGCVALTVLCGAQMHSLIPDTPPTSSTNAYASGTGASVTLVPETDTRIATSVLQMAYLSKNGWDSCDMEKQTEIPMRYRLSVVDVRGLTTAQRDALREEKVEQLQQELCDDFGDSCNARGCVKNAWDNTLFVLLRGGSFQLSVNELKKVDSLRVECSSIYGEVELGVHSINLVDQKIVYQAKNYDGIEQRVEEETRYGNIYLKAMGIALDGKTYDSICSDGELNIYWQPSSKMYEMLNADPTKALSDFVDQMTVTVRYTDGTCERHLLDIVFHDDGSIGAIYRGVAQSDK